MPNTRLVSLLRRLRGRLLRADLREDAEFNRSLILWTFVSAIVQIGAWGWLFLLFDEKPAGFVAIGWASLLAVSVVAIVATNRGLRWHGLFHCVLTLLANTAMTLLLGGLLHSNGQIVWALIAPVGMLIILGPRSALVFFLLFVLAILSCLAAQPYLRQGNNLPLSLKLSFFASNVILMASYVVLLMYFFIARNAELFRLLEAEQKRSEELLLNILPHKIAAVLKHEPRTIADYHEGVSILFADVVDFTPISAELAANELVELLNEVFSGFDELAEKHGLEKIKTIGDCYMAAAGIPQAREDHALALVRMALEMQRLAREHTFRGKRLVFRVGINSGSVVAGVIGRRKFIYDLWGDAVNTASRMESHGRGGFIQITRSTYELIKDDFECVPRGKIPVKGKGEMEVWHVLREKSADGELGGRGERPATGA